MAKLPSQLTSASQPKPSTTSATPARPSLSAAAAGTRLGTTRWPERLAATARGRWVTRRVTPSPSSAPPASRQAPIAIVEVMAPPRWVLGTGRATAPSTSEYRAGSLAADVGDGGDTRRSAARRARRTASVPGLRPPDPTRSLTARHPSPYDRENPNNPMSFTTARSRT